MLFNKNLKILILLLSFTGSNVYGLEKGDWIIRGGVTNIDPQSDTGGIVTVDDKSNLTSTIVYFPTNNVGIEVLLGLPFVHDINALDGITKLGEAKLLPPTVTAQYYFNQQNSGIRPYVGLGYNYTFFLEDRITITTGDLAGGHLEMGSSSGLAFQIGFDWEIRDNFGLNLDIRKFSIEPTANINNISSPMQFDVALDPITLGISLYVEL